ncbi:hypothetical protein MTR_2g025765 [Medicago truncatula]|uniref:Uncharacterized protein n=1 Tax=Medicago truncatula TaxID=3880 RepID=A0A072VFM3_MEDTR|nr:hypothetical protein MTR_2g025765 [Medicago truncatula]
MKLIHFFSIALIQPNKNHVLSNKTTTKKSGKTSPSSCNRNAKSESTNQWEKKNVLYKNHGNSTSVKNGKRDGSTNTLFG